MSAARILLIEDTPSDGRRLVAELVERDVEVILECNRHGAIKAVKTTLDRFDAICIDIRSDLDNGQSTAIAVRASGYSGPIVMLGPCALRISSDSCDLGGITACVPHENAASRLLEFAIDFRRRNTPSNAGQSRS